jgi:hypothetical protein
LALTPSPVVDAVYAEQKDPLPSTPEPTTDGSEEVINNPGPSSPNGAQNPDGETMLLSQAKGKQMTQALDLPQLEVELERAIWQVETAIKKQNAEVAARNSQQTASEEDKKSQ